MNSPSELEPELIACPSCDLLADLSDLDEGQQAHCRRCKHFLTERKPDSLAYVLAYAVSALIFLAVANSFSFLSFKASGLENAMTLPQSALELYRYGMHGLAILVAAFIILIPAVILGLLLMLGIPLYLGRYASWLVTCGRLISALTSWSMVEVFLIGVIVSLVKIAAMATVVLGISFWAYVAFTICFTLALSNLDRYQCWHLIEQLSKR
jgi:paraquat-inducible protein A